MTKRRSLLRVLCNLQCWLRILRRRPHPRVRCHERRDDHPPARECRVDRFQPKNRSEIRYCCSSSCYFCHLHHLLDDSVGRRAIHRFSMDHSTSHQAEKHPSFHPDSFIPPILDMLVPPSSLTSTSTTTQVAQVQTVPHWVSFYTKNVAETKEASSIRKNSPSELKVAACFFRS